MSETYQVESLSEAIELAKEFQFTGKYNLFRGQAQDWEVVPSAGRISRKKHLECIERLKKLELFFKLDGSLNKFIKEIDAFFAIAQHYGIPTNYIDFTTDINVAFYFATNSKSNKIGKNCSIICLNEKEFNNFSEFFTIFHKRKDVHPPYIARINVDNLWRLQAQSGCFLFTPYFQIESFYKFDKIVFPFTEAFKGLSVTEIYPENKSELEILLDQYFNAERRNEGAKLIENFAKENKILVTKLTTSDQEEIFKNKKIHKSWFSFTYEKWNFSLTESWMNLEPLKEIEIKFPSKLQSDEQVNYLNLAILKQFCINEIHRNTPISFKIISKPKWPKKLMKIINKNCVRIWDGTRNLPYSDDEIISIISHYILLEYKNEFDDSFQDELITLELSNGYGSVTRCSVTQSKLVAAFRDDLDDIINDVISRPISLELLLLINKPQYIFDFEKLIDLFKDGMIAYQVLYSSKSDNPVVFYTPARIKVLGYA